MKKIASILLLVVILGVSVQVNTASANEDQVPKLQRMQSFSQLI
ncbi:hypothetical protein SLU01_07540 [Sporosarcina luteola]|uniref:Uncharacterized protein n=1 Tax=Sporosarcina luteola TaxID=582850 RepID=A0A511Z4U3_9BACL|nr:hypothetical protein [Sporosarcina luteola]GEN82442.1 hypothetical protein SLU01_07540 [Sporosarcina luteola]